MRLTVFLVLLSSLAFAQTEAQMQAAQAKAQHNLEAAQQTAQMTWPVDLPVTVAPKFSPKPGTFQGSIPPVAITVGTKGAIIYFTTDGSRPTPKSQRYTGPVSLSATTTLKAIAIAPSFAQSLTTRGKYVVK